MKSNVFVAAVTAALIATPLFAEGPHWTYEGAEGPEFWGELAPEFATCGLGTQQSPIDLTKAVEADAADISLDWNTAATWSVANNGHTIQASSDNAGTMMVGDKSYKLAQFHFHVPSEHAIDGTRAPMEAHFVHIADDGAIAVVGVMMEGGGENGVFDAVMAAAPAAMGDATIGEADPRALMPTSEDFFRYQGSLTTPPCSETVLWTVMKQPVQVADADIAKFQGIFEMNARPLQEANRRYILSE